MASIYLVPAIALGPYRDSALLWKFGWFKPENWSLLRWGETIPPTRAKIIFGALILSALPSTILLLFGAQRRWGVYAVLCLAMAAALVPAIWQLPLLQTVQFPFRMFPLAAFAIATGVSHLALSRVAFATTVPIFTLSILFSLGERSHTVSVKAEKLIAQHADVPENLPPGDRRPSWPSHWALAVARSHPVPVRAGDQTVDPVFYFPAWEVRCQGRRVPTAPEASAKLLTYKGTGCERKLVPTMPERIGTAISLTGLLLLLGLAAFRRRRSPGTRVDDPTLVGIGASPAR
jgi:hypothetical protein